MAKSPLKRVRRGGFQGLALHPRMLYAKKPKGGFGKRKAPDTPPKPTKRQKRKAIDEYKRGKAKKAKRMFEKPEVITEGAQQLSEAEIIENAEVKPIILEEARRFFFDAVRIAAGRRFNNLPSSPNVIPPASTSKTAGQGSIFGNKFRLPPGSTLESRFTIGNERVFPSKQIATPISATVYSSDIADSVGKLIKPAALKVREIGINQTKVCLFPIELPHVSVRRAALAPNWSSTSVNGVTDAQMKVAFDTPSKQDFSSSTGEVIAGGAGRTTTVPVKQSSAFTITNVSKFLGMKVKVSLVQLKRVANATNDEMWTDPYESMTDITGAMQPNNVLVATPVVKSAVSTSQNVWGLTDTEATGMYGSYEVDLQTGVSLKDSPLFEEHVNVIKTVSYNIGAGSSRRICTDRFRSINFSKVGNLDTVAPTHNTVYRGRYTTTDRLYLLVEAHGETTGIPYYRYDTDNDGEVTDRTWSVADSGPASFMCSLDMKHELAAERAINLNASEGGIPYKRSYINVDRELLTSKKVHIPMSEITETELSTINTTRYVVPVNADIAVVGAGVQKLV